MIFMLVDYLEDSAQSLQELEKKIISMDSQYRIFFDRDVKDQMNNLKKEMRKKLFIMVDYMYLHIQELFLLKKHFPDFFNILRQDPGISKAIKKIEWILDFKKLGPDDARKELKKISDQRKQLRNARDFLRKWVGKVDKKEMLGNWPMLKEYLVKDLERDEVFDIIKKKNAELRRQGWLIMLNEPFISHILSNFLQKLKNARQIEIGTKNELEKIKGRGIYARQDLDKELKEAIRSRRRIEKKCEHLLLANYEYFLKLKKIKPDWRDQKIDSLAREIAGKFNVTLIDEKKWLADMNKKLEL